MRRRGQASEGERSSFREAHPRPPPVERGSGPRRRRRYAAQKAASGLDQCHCKSPCAFWPQLVFDELRAMRFELLVHAFLVHPHQTPAARHIGGKAADSRHCSLGAFSSHTNLPSNSPNPPSDVRSSPLLESPRAVIEWSQSEGARRLMSRTRRATALGRQQKLSSIVEILRFARLG